MIKTQQIRQKKCNSIITPMYDKVSANITLSGERLNPFSLRLGTRLSCPLSSFNILLAFLARATDGKGRSCNTRTYLQTTFDKG